MSTITRMLRTGIIAVAATVLALTTLTAVTHSSHFALSDGPGDSHWTVTANIQQ